MTGRNLSAQAIISMALIASALVLMPALFDVLDVLWPAARTMATGGR